MNFSFVTCAAAFFSLFAAVFCAPTGTSLQTCANVRNSSLEFNQIAKNLSVLARNGSKDLADFSTTPLWMEAKDMCDPGTLKNKPLTCIGKMLSVLRSYNSLVESMSGFQSCTKFINDVKPVMKKLDEDMSACVKSRGGVDQEKDSHDDEDLTKSVENWQEDLVCHYIMDRLFSFSILTARVFAVGDPSDHGEGSGHKCG